LQRRETYRLSVEGSNAIQLRRECLAPWLPCAENPGEIDSVVLDISAGGMRWAIPGNQQKDVHAGKTLENLGLSVLGCGEFQLDFDVSYSQWVPALGRVRAGHTIVGGRFVGAGTQQVKRLEHYIAVVQRQRGREKSEERSIAA